MRWDGKDGSRACACLRRRWGRHRGATGVSPGPNRGDSRCRGLSWVGLGLTVLLAGPVVAEPSDPRPSPAIDAVESRTAPSDVEAAGAGTAVPDGTPEDWEARYQAGALDVTAVEQIGRYYELGAPGRAPDPAEALRWYTRAATPEAPHNMLRVAWMHLSANGVPVDRAAAERWMQRAIAVEYWPAFTGLASVLIADAMSGRATERMPEAIDLLERAQRGGFVMAAYFLARVYLEGLGGVEVDDALGARYAEWGADHGHAQLQGWTAFLYLEGRGVEADEVAALKWASLAAAQGDTFGGQIREYLERTLDQDAIDAGRSAAVAWAVERATGRQGAPGAE